MPTFRINGSTGAAPITQFFGTIPDALTLLSPMHQNNVTNTDPTMLATDYRAAFLCSQWIPYNTSFTGGSNAVTCSFGANTTAPDGSNNAVHLTEATTNSQHYISAGVTNAVTNNQRLQVFVKAAERTRVGLGFVAPGVSSGGVSPGVRCIFDLSGGQIGVANHVFNSTGNGQAAGTAFIESWPNGWFKCTMEWLPGTIVGGNARPSAVLAQIWIDSGSGTGAESVSYTGDGSSGIYLWKACSLPRELWGFGHNMFLDDEFNSISTADTTRTNVPGFNWYMSDNWPGPTQFGSGQTAPAGCLTCDGSNFILQQQPGGIFPTVLGAHTDGTNTPYPGGYVAGPNSVWQPPMWFQLRFKGYTATVGTEAGIFNLSLEALTTQNNAHGGLFPIIDGYHRGEFDLISANGTLDPDPSTLGYGTYGPGTNVLSGGVEPGFNSIIAQAYPLWVSTRMYNNGNTVEFAGVVYQANNPTNSNSIIGQEPDISPTWWNVYSLVPLFVNYTLPAYDRGQFNIFDWIWVPSFVIGGGANNGFVLCFLNGNFIQEVFHNDFSAGIYSYSTTGTNGGGTGLGMEGGHWVVVLNGDNDLGIVGCTYDYLRMRK